MATISCGFKKITKIGETESCLFDDPGVKFAD